MIAINNALSSIIDSTVTTRTRKAHIIERAEKFGFSADLVAVAVIAAMEFASKDLDNDMKRKRSSAWEYAKPNFHITDCGKLTIHAHQNAYYQAGQWRKTCKGICVFSLD